MKTFEEKWTAWLDGQLPGKELAEFEASLPDKTAAELEKHDALKLGALLKEQLRAPAMHNAEFFNHQLRQQIASESAPAVRPVESSTRETWWSISRLLWTGATSLAIFAVCTFFVMREEPSTGQSPLTTQILSARISSPDATISMFESKEDKATVLWIDGLQSLPSEYATK